MAPISTSSAQSTMPLHAGGEIRLLRVAGGGHGDLSAHLRHLPVQLTCSCKSHVTGLHLLTSQSHENDFQSKLTGFWRNISRTASSGRGERSASGSSGGQDRSWERSQRTWWRGRDRPRGQRGSNSSAVLPPRLLRDSCPSASNLPGTQKEPGRDGEAAAGAQRVRERVAPQHRRGRRGVMERPG